MNDIKKIAKILKFFKKKKCSIFFKKKVKIENDKKLNLD